MTSEVKGLNAYRINIKNIPTFFIFLSISRKIKKKKSPVSSQKISTENPKIKVKYKTTYQIFSLKSQKSPPY